MKYILVKSDFLVAENTGNYKCKSANLWEILKRTYVEWRQVISKLEQSGDTSKAVIARQDLLLDHFL